MYVYILRSSVNPGRVYVGRTIDLERRLDEHNSGLMPATYRFRPWQIDVSVWFKDEDKAIAFEAYLKSGSGRAFSKRHL